MRLSESLEDYLETIAELSAVDGHAHTKEIADKLGVKMPSVTGALKQLEQAGLIVYNTHYPVMLTAAGRKAAGMVIRRRTVLSGFLSGVLGLSPERASEVACRIEHAVDDDIIERFTILTEALSSRSDAGGLRDFLSEAMNCREPE